LIRHGPHRKWNNYGDTHRQQGDLISHNIRYRDNVSTEPLPSNDGGIHFPWYDTGHIENASNNSSIVANVFVTSVTFLPSRCLTTIWRIHIQTHNTVYSSDSQTVRRKKWLGVPRISQLCPFSCNFLHHTYVNSDFFFI
jgi:hypothetical protein